MLPVATSCHQQLPVATIATSRYQLLSVATSCYQVDTSCCLSFSDCWMSLHANSCFVFINSLLFQGGSTPLNPHKSRIIVNYLSKCHTFPVCFVFSLCIGLPFKMATYSKSSKFDVLIYPFKFDFDTRLFSEMLHSVASFYFRLNY